MTRNTVMTASNVRAFVYNGDSIFDFLRILLSYLLRSQGMFGVSDQR